jgi:hypothetical protein
MAVRDLDGPEKCPIIREIRPRWCWRSPAYEADVNDQVDARAEGRCLTGQKDDRSDQLVNVGHAAHRGVGLELLCLPRHLRAQIHRGSRVARTDGVDAYASETIGSSAAEESRSGWLATFENVSADTRAKGKTVPRLKRICTYRKLPTTSCRSGPLWNASSRDG